MTKFAGMVSATNVTFTGITGRNHVIAAGHPNDTAIRDLMRTTQAAFKSGDTVEATRLWQEMTDLADIPAAITKATAGKVVIVGDEVHYDGEELHNAITRRILWTVEQKYDPQSYMLFLDNLMENPSKRAVDELFGFMEACEMGITEDGHLIAYKRVRDDYMDIYSGSIRNRVGDKPRMRRNGVDENKDRTCSNGLHFCSFTYLPHFGAGSGNKVVILKINPRDVVSIPADYNNAKGRTCSYEVIGEYEGDDLADILSVKSVWSGADQQSHFNQANVRPDRKAIIDRLLAGINAESDREIDISGETTLSDLPFYVRSRLGQVIEDEFAIEIESDRFEDDDLTLDSLAEDIYSELAEGYEEDQGLETNENEDNEENEENEELDENDSRAQSGEGTVVENNDSPVPVYSASTPVIDIYSEQDGNVTRWFADCPACNGGAGWKQSYARKRDARRGVKREFGDAAVVRERD